VFVVRRKRTTKEKKRPAKSLPCVFPQNARQRPHDTDLHGKQSLSCIYNRTHSNGTLSYVKTGARQQKRNRRTADKRTARAHTVHLRALSSNARQRIFQKKQRPHSRPHTSAGRPAAAQRPDAGSCALPLVLPTPELLSSLPPVGRRSRGGADPAENVEEGRIRPKTSRRGRRRGVRPKPPATPPQPRMRAAARIHAAARALHRRTGFAACYPGYAPPRGHAGSTPAAPDPHRHTTSVGR
jgi:hypothetical protein